MAEENKNSNAGREERQSWQPHWILRTLRALWMVVFSAAKIALGAVATVLIICVICGLVFIGTLGDYLQDDVLPEAEINLENFDLDQTSFLYYVDGEGNIQQLQVVYTTTDRQWATYDEIPEELIHAAVAIEDKRFYEHQGVDWITTVKACINMFFGSSSTFGGSTITQQLIKNLTTEDSVTVQRKVLEIFRAQEFEQRYDKKVVMEWYLNTIYLGEGCYGIKSAAATYFGKELELLTPAECASLISITNNPSLYDPYIDEEKNRERQLNVLDQMLDQDWLTQEEYDEAVAQEMVFKSGIDLQDRLAHCPNEACGYEGTVSAFTTDGTDYYCPQCGSQTEVSQNASENVYSWFVDTVLEDVAKHMAEENGLEWNDETQKQYMELIRRGGYHIYTTLDMDVQNAVDAVYEDLSRIPEARSGQQLQSGIVVVDNMTGDIVAMAGGVGEKMDFDAFNRATDSTLQTGSSIKPLTVYAPAFEMGVITPATVIDDMPLYYDDGAFPLNFTRNYSYKQTVYSGVEESINAIAVGVLDRIGTSYSYDFAKNKFGLSTLTDNYVLDSGRSLSDVGYAPLALGALTEGATIRDMTCAFATFANDGVYRQGRTFTKVYDSDGNLVIDNAQKSSQILSQKSVDYMNYCLVAAAAYGTDYVANFSNIEVAGKTGTTSDNKDRWFCGFTGHYTAAVWCGYDNPEVINLVNDYRNPAARLWAAVMEPIHEGKGNIDLYNRDVLYGVTVCLDSGKIATSACGKDVRTISRTAYARVYSEDYPTAVCDKHVLIDYCTTGQGVATEYCKKFAEVDASIKIEERALVKMTQNELNDLQNASYYNLNSEFLNDAYIYFVDSNGQALSFHGLKGDANVGVDAPYIVCTVHTKAAWEAYEKAQAATKPTTPTVTVKPGN